MGRQLVGQACVLCQERISSELAAQFCRYCRSPSHHHCSLAAREPLVAESCTACGAPGMVIKLLKKEERDKKTEDRERARMNFMLVRFGLLMATTIVIALVFLIRAFVPDPKSFIK